MTDIIKSQSEIVKPQSGTPIAKSTKPRRGRPQTPKIEPIDVGVETKSEVDLTDVAIAAADAPFARATNVFDKRYAENLQEFGRHVRSRTQQTSEFLLKQVLGEYDYTENSLYEGDDE